ncbi:MAG: aldo/keto reductase [Spirochaetaceae bacterium]|nr:aldo/keto reductase [Spirochaetaceae bacterium]|tara:strand:- start:12082 stop:13077 length:996 start_codon:yes stop_codon:yes gene_type:complete
MELKNIGKSNVQVTPLTFGAWAIGGWMWGGAEEKDAVDAIRKSLDLGVTTIDTAPVYGFGRSEEIVGKALKEVPRDHYQILTKCGMNWETEEGEYFFETNDDSGRPIRMHKFAGKSRVLQECEDSLRRLKTDYIDLFQLHWPDATTPINETMEAFEKLMEDGKIRAAGVCNYSAEQMKEALKTTELASNQVRYSMVSREMETDVLPAALEAGMSILPYSPMERGFLTGKFHSGSKFNAGDTRATSKWMQSDNMHKLEKLIAVLQEMADGKNATIAQLVLRWTMDRKGIATVLAGARNPAQIEENAGSLSLSLSPEEKTKIEDSISELGLIS